MGLAITGRVVEITDPATPIWPRTGKAYTDELDASLVKSITELAGDGEYKFMEVCGGHTHTIAAYYNFGRLHRETAALVGQQRAAAHG